MLGAFLASHDANTSSHDANTSRLSFSVSYLLGCCLMLHFRSGGRNESILCAGKKIYVMGGFDGNDWLKTVEMYEPGAGWVCCTNTCWFVHSIRFLHKFLRRFHVMVFLLKNCGQLRIYLRPDLHYVFRERPALKCFLIASLLSLITRSIRRWHLLHLVPYSISLFANLVTWISRDVWWLWRIIAHVFQMERGEEHDQGTNTVECRRPVDIWFLSCKTTHFFAWSGFWKAMKILCPPRDSLKVAIFLISNQLDQTSNVSDLKNATQSNLTTR